MSLVLLLGACHGAASRPTPAAPARNVLTIVTPTPGTPPPRTPTPPLGQRRYVVRDGDTLSSIADRFGITQDALQRANSITNPDTIYVGQALIIPPPEP